MRDDRDTRHNLVSCCQPVTFAEPEIFHSWLGFVLRADRSACRRLARRTHSQPPASKNSCGNGSLSPARLSRQGPPSTHVTFSISFSRARLHLTNVRTGLNETTLRF